MYNVHDVWTIIRLSLVRAGNENRHRDGGECAEATITPTG